MRGDRTGLRQNLAALDVLALEATNEAASVVASLATIKILVEHLDAGDGRLLRVPEAHDLDFVTDSDDALLDAARHDGATTGDREDVLDCHQERLVRVTNRLRNVGVDGVHQFHDRLGPLLVALERLQSGNLNHRNVVTRELVLGEQLANLELDELEHLGIVHHVGLVEGDNDVRHADLAGQEDVLARLRHRAVSSGHDQDCAVHLGGTRDHVLDVVGMARAIDVGVMTRLGLVLNVRGVDRNTALALFGSVVDRCKVTDGAGAIALGKDLRDCSGQRRLAMVDVTDGADIEMGLVSLELLLGHYLLPGSLGWCGWSGSGGLRWWTD